MRRAGMAEVDETAELDAEAAEDAANADAEASVTVEFSAFLDVSELSSGIVCPDSVWLDSLASSAETEES